MFIVYFRNYNCSGFFGQDDTVQEAVQNALDMNGESVNELEIIDAWEGVIWSR